MKIRLTFLASIAIALSLALVGVLKDASPTGANQPRPVQPFKALSTGGISTTQLGQQIASNFTKTEALQGERVTLPWIYSGAGFSVDTTDNLDTDVGSVWSMIDVQCDGAVDKMQLKDTCASPPEDNPLRWIKKTTAVAGTDEEYLLKIMPPFTWLLRHRAIIETVCYGAGQLTSPSVLNTVYANIPFSPTVNGHQTFVAQTQLGGAPDTPPSKVCLDSPQTSESITTVYNNPPMKNADVGADGLDDASGLYARWTIFGSRGSSSLNVFSDLRKSYQSPPSLPSDIGYVERIIQLECFWEDQYDCFTDEARTLPCDSPDASPPGDDSGFVSPEESWNDWHLRVQLGGKAHVDVDGDCLMNSAHVQPGWAALGAVDAFDDPTGVGIVSCDANPNWKVYSENPVVVHHNTANDQDCDGLVDGIDWFWGGTARVTSADWDSDGAPDFVEMFQFTSPANPDTDADGFADKPATVYGNNTDTSMDNCPTVKNGASEDNQLNSDGARRINGNRIAETYASNPNQDKMGDACDTDNDNDGAVDGYELARCADATDNDSDGKINDGCPAVGPAETACADAIDNDSDGKINDGCAAVGLPENTDPFKLDSDSDTVNDGAELRLKLADPFTSDPLNSAIRPDWSNDQQVYYRGCHIAVNHAGSLSPDFNEQDTTVDNVEMDVDGDGATCPGDSDSDNGGLGHATKTEILDSIEAYGYNTIITNPDTDGDGCQDWVEINDLNGDRTVDSGDQGQLNRRAGGKILSDDPVSEYIYDINKDGFVADSGDQGMLNRNTCALKPWGGCPSCPLED